jgi:hypothetical protein
MMPDPIFVLRSGLRDPAAIDVAMRRLAEAGCLPPLPGYWVKPDGRVLGEVSADRGRVSSPPCPDG